MRLKRGNAPLSAIAAGLRKKGRDDRRGFGLLLDVFVFVGGKHGRILPEQQCRRQQVRVHIPAVTALSQACVTAAIRLSNQCERVHPTAAATYDVTNVQS